MTRLPRLLALVTLALAAAPGLIAQTVYWEYPQALAPQGSRFTQAVSTGSLAVIAWQEFVPTPGEPGGRLYLSLAATRDFRTFTRSERFFGPIPYSEKEVPIFSLAVTSRGLIYCAVLTGPTSVAVLASRDGGRSFRAVQEQSTPTTTVAPYLAVTARDTLLLFVTQTVESAAGTAAELVTEQGAVIQTQPITLAWSRSSDGIVWDPFKRLVSAPEVGTNLKPSLVSWHGREYVVFQAANNTYEYAFYHLFLVWSGDDGLSWTDPKPLLFSESVGGSVRTEASFDNQRPFIQALGDRLGLAWERGEGFGARQIYFSELDAAGDRPDLSPLRAASQVGQAASNPQIVVLRGEPYLVWFDSRGGNGAIILAERGDIRWNELDLARGAQGANLFGRPLVLGGELYVAWDNQRGDVRSVQIIGPDRTVAAPVFAKGGFTPGRRDRRSTVTVDWIVPQDSSGIDAFAYSWDRDPQGGESEEFQVPAATTRAVVTADQDGLWYFHVRARDRAANWSGPGTIAYYRDTTPPPPVAFAEPALDDKGFLLSNTYSLGWRPTGDDEIAGYSYRVDLLGPETMKVGGAGLRLAPPPAWMVVATTEVRGTNEDNGTWALVVSAVDTAGNVGEAASLLYRLNKYVPVTYISNVQATVDRLGNTSLTLFGRGFEQGGLIARLVLDRDGVAPYDYEFPLESGIYTVLNDRVVDNVRLPVIAPGTYRVGVEHPTRGMKWSPNTIGFLERGTVKIGDYSYSFSPAWQLRPGKRFLVNASDFVVWLVVAFLGVLAVVAARRLLALAAEGRMLREEVAAIIEGRGSPMQKKQAELKVAARRGMGLRLKFSLLMVLLVLLIVLIVSIPLSLNMIKAQRETLVVGLFDRVQVLMGSISIGAEEPLKAVRVGGNEFPLYQDLPNQIDQMDETTYVLITGAGRSVQDQQSIDFLWGYRFKDRPDNRDIGEFLEPGATPDAYGSNRLLADEPQMRAAEFAAQVEAQATAKLAGTVGEIAALNVDVRRLAGLANPDTKTKQDLQAASGQLAQKERERAQALISYKVKEIRSLPEFDLTGQRLPDAYEFVKPIIYTLPGDTRNVRGLVRMGVSTASIQKSIDEALRNLIQQTGLVALAALGLGILGAIILASMTVAPIKRLARGVAEIRDTEDKEKLAEHRIDIRSRDEIGTLARTVNEMTQGLVAAASASKDLMVGQETQKMFISLDVGADGKKGNVGGLDTDKIEIFGFYEGARTVSGDYFEYIKLDDRHYAFMKCDVAGKGVPAALVMVEVATLFSAFTRKWPQSQEKFRLDRFVYEVNDMLEVRGFKGRFAAFVVCILNVETGVSYLCNAGDNILHYFDSEERKTKNLGLPSSPAAGVFPSSLVELQTGFQQIKHTLKRGDIYAFHTDGVEEDHRYFRDSDGNTRVYDEPDVEAERRHSFAPKKGEDSEMIETERLFGVMDACLNRSTYVMSKFYNPNPGEKFTFDFSKGAGTPREAVLAAMGLDKVFRVYKDSSVDENSRVSVDRNIAEFLRTYYVQYDEYFAHPVEDDGKSAKVTFSHLKEDEQFDDLTMLLVRRK